MEDAQQMLGHADSRTTRKDSRRRPKIVSAC
jgi:hypothetical protein